MSVKLATLTLHLKKHLEGKVQIKPIAFGELSVDVEEANYVEVMRTLRDTMDLHFEEMIDLAGVDYSEYQDGKWQGKRFAVVVHLSSILHNTRLRVRCFAQNDDFPSLPTLTNIWNSANWYEREAFDLFGIVFPGHEDLRRLLTDYGFVGHPFRKDFPVYGHVEMRYDPNERRLVYQPVTIEPREVTPRIVREETYGASDKESYGEAK